LLLNLQELARIVEDGSLHALYVKFNQVERAIVMPEFDERYAVGLVNELVTASAIRKRQTSHVALAEASCKLPCASWG
jgi:hypothetical protein